MPLIDLTCDNLAELDSGFARGAIDSALADALDDLEERGHDGKSRTVTIKVVLKRPKGRKADDTQVVGAVSAGVAKPPYATDDTKGELRRRSVGGKSKAEMVFQQFNGENPDQPTIDDVIDAQRGK